MDSKKMLIAGGIGLAIALAIGGSASAATDPNAGSSSETGGEDTPTTGSGTGTGAATGFPLKRGSKGEKVRKLQQWLGVKVDGDFGPLTETALKKRTGLTYVLNAATFDALLASASTANQTQPATTIASAEQLAASLYTACLDTKNVVTTTQTQYGYPTQTTRAVSSYKTTPDYDSIQRVFAGRTDADYRVICGVFQARYGAITGGNFGHMLDHWNSTALKLYGLNAIRTKLATLGL